MRRAALLLALGAPAIAHAQAAPPCPGFEGGSGSATDADRFYGLRAAGILRAGITGDRAQLAALVSPSANVEVWYGDNGWGPRGADRAVLTGPDAIIALAGRLKPRGFITTLVLPGPISVVLKRCEWDAKLLVRSETPGTGVSLTFEFKDGILVSVAGTEVGVIEGMLP